MSQRFARALIALSLVACAGAPCPPPSVGEREEWWHLPGSIHLVEEGNDIDAPSRAFLEQAVHILENRSDVRRVRVEGHTDERAHAEQNQTLSEEHARVVADILTGMGVTRSMIEVVGHGASRRIAIGEANPLNRRVELSFLLARPSGG